MLFLPFPLLLLSNFSFLADTSMMIESIYPVVLIATIRALKDIWVPILVLLRFDRIILNCLLFNGWVFFNIHFSFFPFLRFFNILIFADFIFILLFTSSAYDSGWNSLVLWQIFVRGIHSLFLSKLGCTFALWICFFLISFPSFYD